MAKIFSTPEELPEPEVDYKNYDMAKEAAKEKAWLEKLQAYCVKHGNGDTAGKEISTGVADGRARYMVLSEKPLRLIHLRLGDAYSAGPIWEGGLRLYHVRKMVDLSSRLSRLEKIF